MLYDVVRTSALFVADGTGDGRLDASADDDAAQRSDPVDEHVLMYRGTTTAEHSHTGPQRV